MPSQSNPDSSRALPSQDPSGSWEPGWYQDGKAPSARYWRYWDGERWTRHWAHSNPNDSPSFERGGTKWDPQKIGKPAEREAGWYDDPQRPDLHQLRYWNGSGWTDRTSSWLSAGASRWKQILPFFPRSEDERTEFRNRPNVEKVMGVLGVFVFLIFVLALLLMRLAEREDTPSVVPEAANQAEAGTGPCPPGQVPARPDVEADRADVNGPAVEYDTSSEFPVCVTPGEDPAVTIPPATSSAAAATAVGTAPACTPTLSPGTISGAIWRLEGVPPIEYDVGSAAVNRADAEVLEDCRINLEIHWQVAVQTAEGGRACSVLIGLAEGQLPTTSDGHGDTITTRLGASLGLFETCPGIDEPGNLRVLLGGNEGQIGSFLSGNSRITEITATIGPTLRIEPFTVETGYQRMTLQVD